VLHNHITVSLVLKKEFNKLQNVHVNLECSNSMKNVSNVTTNVTLVIILQINVKDVLQTESKNHIVIVH